MPLGKLHQYSVPLYYHHEMEIITVPSSQGFYEEEMN